MSDFDAGVSNNCNIFLNSVDFIDQGIENEDDIEIPVSHQENLWYHGRLDRYSAEERLSHANKPGSFLVRESDRKPGSYVLSYLGNSGINHFRITAVCGDFYIGGRQFNSLANLISYYVHCSDLLRKERLSYPVPPPEPVNDKKRVIAILPYTKMPDTDELSFQKGDIFFVHNDMSDGWLWVTAHRTGEQGMIFQELVQDLDGNIDPNSVFSWFHPNITKPEAVDLLVKAGPGSFMVRPSDNSPGDYSLFFHINNQIQRFRIEKRGVRYFMGGRTFECLDAVINRYRKEQIVDGYTLGNPINKTSEPSPLNGIKEVLHADKIYETLRECREYIGLKKSKGIRMQSYLYKRNEKDKKWKYLYFVLSSGEGSAACGNSDTHLCFYDNPKRTKPRGLIDLTCAYLYQVHDSIFDQSYCFQLVEKALPCISTVTYLAAASPDIFQLWISTLKPLCVTQISGISKGHKLRELRCLHLHILNARRLPLKLVPNPFFIISLNQIKVAKTKVKSSSDLFWDEEFSFEDIPADVLGFSVTLYNKGKRSKDSEIAAVTMDLNTLENGNELEDWFHLSGITPVGEWGSIQLKIQYLHDLIMPVEEYSPLQQLILDPDMEAVKALSKVCYLDRFTLANSLYSLFVCDQKLAELLISLNQEEIARELVTATLFRSSSITTSIMDMFMKSVCTDFLVHALYDPICKLLESKISCELNPDKMDSTDDACSNAEFLLQFLDEIALSIFSSVESCPKTLRYICGFLQRSVVSKWPHDKLVRTRVVSGFIFLRLLCPAILNPRQFHIISDIPPPSAVRSLTMVAKCLQNLANLVEFGSKEPYMEVVNPFILKNKERMIVFLDQLSNITEKPDPEYKIKGDVAREMAILHHVCVSHLNELKMLSNNQISIKKLVTVTEMLSRHKQKYLEMIA